MRDEKIIERCTTKLGMTQEQAQTVVDNIYTYFMPDWSEWSWSKIDRMFRDTLRLATVAAKSQCPTGQCED